MSWEIIIQDLPPVRSLADVPASHEPAPIGLRTEIEQAVRMVFPGVQRQDDWLFVRSADHELSIQVVMEDALRVRYLHVHVHGGDRSAFGVAALLKHLGLRGVDTRTGELFDTDALDEGL